MSVVTHLTTAQPVGNYLTTAMMSNRGSDFVNANGGVTGTNITGTIFSNGLSLSVAAPGAGGGGAAISGDANSQSTGTVNFSNSNGVSFGLSNNGVMTATVATNYQSQGAYLTTAQPVGAYLTTAMLSNAGSNFVGLNSALTANGVSMTNNSSGLSLNFPAFLTTAQPVGAYLTTARASNDAIGLNTALTANGVSVTANSSGLSINVPAFLTTAMQSASSSVFAKTGFASTTTNGSVVAGTLNTNGMTLAVPAYLTTAQAPGAYLTTAMQTGSQSQLWVMGNSSGTIGGTNISGTVFSNGMSLSANAPAAGVGIAAGTRTATTAGNLLFETGNGITFGLNAVGGSVMTASHNAITTAMQTGSQSQLWIMGNSSGAIGGTNITGTMFSNGLSLSVAAPGAGGGIANAAGTQTATSGTVLFNNANGITFGMSNSSVITASYNSTQFQSTGNYLTTARASNDAVGLNTALTANGVAWTVNSSGLSLNVPAFLTTAAQSGHSHGNPTLALTNLSGTTASNSAGLTLSLSAAAPGAGAAVTVSASNGSFTVGQLNFSNANNVTFGTSAGSIVTASVAAPGGGGALTLSQYQNMDRGTSTLMGVTHGTIIFQRLNQENDLFAGNITANTFLINMSGTASSGASSTQTIAANSTSVSLGIYTVHNTNASVLTLVNSVSTSFGSGATYSIYPHVFGGRWLSFHSSQWSAQPSFSAGGDYVFAIGLRTAGASTALSLVGQYYMNSHLRSGYWGVSTTTGNTSQYAHGNLWNGLYSASSAALPVSVSNNALNRAAIPAVFVPHILMHSQGTW